MTATTTTTAPTPSPLLRLPSDAQIRRTFQRRQSPTPELHQFMRTIAPMVKNRMITYIIASSASYIGAMGPERRARHLANLMESVNFPQDVARELRQAVEQITTPEEYLRDADRLAPSLENLTAAFVAPEDDAPRQQVYDEVMEAFDGSRQHLVREIARALVGYGVTHESMRERYLHNAAATLPSRMRGIDVAAQICNEVLHDNPAAWQERRLTPAQVARLQSEARTRDDEVQKIIDEDHDVEPNRYVLAIIDEMIMGHCERAIAARSRHLAPFAFWQDAAAIAQSRL